MLTPVCQGAHLSSREYVPPAMTKIQENMYNKGYALVHDILLNYPEYSSEWIACSKFGYNDFPEYATETFPPKDFDYSMEFRVGRDGDYVNRDTPIYLVTVSEVAQIGFVRMFMAFLAGEASGYFPGGIGDFFDPGCWDSESTDALMQYHFYGQPLCG